MGDYTVTVTPLQEQGLQYVVDKYNATQAPQKDEQGNDIPIVPVTKGQYFRDLIRDVLNDYIRQGIEDETSRIGQKYKEATDAQKQKIKTLLGL